MENASFSIEQSGVEEGGKRYQMPVLPSREPIKDWQKYWQEEDEKLFSAAAEKGEKPDEYIRYHWYAYAPYGSAERPYKGVVVSGQEYSGYAKVIKGGASDRPFYSAVLETSVPITDAGIREQIARQVIPQRFFQGSAK